MPNKTCLSVIFGSWQPAGSQAMTNSGCHCLSSSLKTPKVPASNPWPPHTPALSLHFHWLPDNKLDNLNQESHCQGIAAEVFKFQVPGLEWVISNSISGEFLWVLPRLAEGEMTQTVEHAVPNGSSMWGLLRLLGMALMVPKGSTEEG